MEAIPGVFVSSLGRATWEPDPDVPGSEMHVLVETDGVEAGFTRIDRVDGPVRWTPDRRETVVIIEGHVRIETHLGPDIELGPGDAASFPAGLAMDWHVTVPFKEFWVFA